MNSTLRKTIISELINKIKNYKLILFDLGASGGIYNKWVDLLSYSNVEIFMLDADTRDLKSEYNCNANITVLNSFISDKNEESCFYLTKAPYCSSMLKPKYENLNKFNFSDLFEIEKIIKLKSVDINTIITSYDIKYIDWYKTDLQGIDYRVYSSLSSNIKKQILIKEFEPGIENFYEKEDDWLKILIDLNEDYFIYSFIVNGPQRVSISLLKKYNIYTQPFKYPSSLLPMYPGWCNISFLKKFEKIKDEILLYKILLFMFLEKQYGIVLEILDKYLVDNKLLDIFLCFIRTILIDYEKKYTYVNKIKNKNNIILKIKNLIKKNKKFS